ncbi:MAG: NADH:ubiquinone oxidoreductase subunit J [Gammaproteobacteria bacterium RBG_16_51_14]|nr:MAG: NADH:ubiquinone oxidoreductase subunit J [Gammaproteobacteria bacterium RBG_16_51_14]
MFEQIIFYFFAALLVLSAAMVITVRNPVFAALFLVLSFFSSAAIWLMLEAEFLAIVLVLVYVGAVMVLFLFVVMMLDINLSPLREGFARYLPVGIVVALLMVVAMGLVVRSNYFGAGHYYASVPHEAGYSNTTELGNMLYTTYLYQFEIAGAILLVAIIAAISLTLRRVKLNKAMKPEEQVAVKRKDRVRMVKMAPEKREP